MTEVPRLRRRWLARSFRLAIHAELALQQQRDGTFRSGPKAWGRLRPDGQEQAGMGVAAGDTSRRPKRSFHHALPVDTPALMRTSGGTIEEVFTARRLGVRSGTYAGER